MAQKTMQKHKKSDRVSPEFIEVFLYRNYLGKKSSYIAKSTKNSELSRHLSNFTVPSSRDLQLMVQTIQKFGACKSRSFRRTNTHQPADFGQE
jgi:hypothetical protein